MYHIVMKDLVTHSYAHPTVSTVTGELRQVWQVVEEMATMVGEVPTAEIAATVDCQHEEQECPCIQAVMEQLAPPVVEPVSERAARKLKSSSQ
jgi:hypothetical protein